MAGRPDGEIVVVHGVGNQRRAEMLDHAQEGLLAFLNRRLRTQSRVTSRPVPAQAHLERGYDLEFTPAADGEPQPGESPRTLRLREIRWSDLDGDLDPTPGEFLRLLGWLARCLPRGLRGGLAPVGTGKARSLGLWARAGGLYVLLWLAGMAGLGLAALNLPFRGRYNLTARAAGCLMEYLGDLMELEHVEVRRTINQRLHRQLNEILALDRPGFLVIVAHSLGNVFVRDQLVRQLNPAPVPTGWVSVGSPLWVLPLIDPGMVPPPDLDLDLALGWHNLYDPMDPLAGPISHPDLANADRQWYRAHWSPYAAHTSYLSHAEQLARVWEVAAAGLALPTAPAPRARAPRHRRPLRLGPFLRHAAPGEMAVWTAFQGPGSYRADLFRQGQHVAGHEAQVADDGHFIKLWRFTGLEPDGGYDLGLGWRDEDGRWWPLCRSLRSCCERVDGEPCLWPVRAASRAEGRLNLLFASCHYPRHMHFDGLSGNAFLRELLDFLRRRPELMPHAQFFIGDQVYADDWWHDQLFQPWRDTERKRWARLGVYGEVYDDFWRHRYWERLLRLAPSCMMWDDHDIRDGWGSNPNDYVDGRLTPQAREKFAAASEAFGMYQAMGNPPATGDRDWQFSLDMGPVSLFIFDPRTHRDYQDPVDYHPFGPDQMARYQDWLAQAGQRASVLIAVTSSPTAFLRAWRLNLAAYTLPPLMRWMERFLHISGFDDDWRDQLPCRLNANARDAIVEGLAGWLMERPAGERRALLVAGDVHVGGFARIRLPGGRQMHQWIASPLTNRPGWGMHKAAAWALPGRRAGRLDGRDLVARDFWLKPVRNALVLSLLPPPAEGLAPRVAGELIYESGFSTRNYRQILD